MKYHLIGICGAGMSAVAKLLIEQGHIVTGSDEGFYPPISTYLEDHAIPCLSPHRKENIPQDVDYIVIGKHAKLTKEDNEEVAYAFTKKDRILSFPEVLEQITKERERIVVAGSYGKSTVTALLAHILEKAKKDPGYFIGALPLSPKTNAHIGTGVSFILEGDEYPSSNTDTTSKFLYYHPKHLIVTALAHDHVNIFATHADYIAPFQKLIDTTESSGVLVMCNDDTTIGNLLPTITRPVITYGLKEDSLYSATTINYGEVTTFTITKSKESLLTVTTTLLGQHNVQNCIGVAALLLETQLVTKEELEYGLSTFKGIVRRLDKKSEKTSIPIYEGFGSSHDKAVSAIEAIKLHFPNNTLKIIFEPHTFSWRNKAALHWYDSVFAGAGHVYLYKPPTHGSSSHDQLSQEEIIQRVKNSGIPVSSFTSKESGVAVITEDIQDNDIILILSSGGMDGCVPEIVAFLEKNFPL